MSGPGVTDKTTQAAVKVAMVVGVGRKSKMRADADAGCLAFTITGSLLESAHLCVYGLTRIKRPWPRHGILVLKKTEEDHSSIVLPRAGLITVMLTLIAVVSLLILRQMPAVDVAISAFFYSAGACNAPDTVEDCNEFLASVSPFWLNLREIGYYLPQILMLSLFLWQLWQLFFRRNKVMRDFILPIVGIYSAALGPGLITNEILKDNWGRPRPLTTVDFGGKFPYVLPGDMASYCDVNCSFVSGEATAAFWMLVFVFYLTGKARWRAAAGIFLLAVAISVLRIAFGRHYFSDVVMAMFVAFWSIAFVFWVVQTSPVSRFICWILDWSNRCADVLRKSR